MDFTQKRRADSCIAQGALTNSKRPESHVLGVYPTHFVKGTGCQLLATDGQWYLDYICGLGTNFLGYGNESVAREISVRLRDGYSHSFPTTCELETAEALKEIVPFVDQWKFLKSGSEACSAAIRIARTATGRKKVLSAGYHGWHDGFVSLTPPAVGIVDSDRLDFHLLDLSKIDERVAAVIVEPVTLEWSDARFAQLLELRQKCTDSGVILIFDEIITGFRVPRYTASNYSAVAPDLIVLGKAMASGMPLAAVGGKKDLMSGDYFVSSTYAGETLSLAACKAVCRVVQQSSFLETQWENATRFQRSLNDLLKPIKIWISGYPTRGVFAGDQLTRGLFFQSCAQANILFGPSFFWCVRHSEYETQVFAAVNDIVHKIQTGQVRLMGQMPQPAYAQKVRGES